MTDSHQQHSEHATPLQGLETSLLDTSVLEENIKKYTPYLREVQKHFWITIAIFGVGATIGFMYYQDILSFVMKRLNLSGINLVLTSPTQFIDLAIQTGIILGFLLATPYFIYCLLQFVLPALQAKERQVVLSMLPLGFALAIVGFGFGVWIEQFVISLYAKTTVDFNIGNYWDVGHFFEQFMIMGFCMAMVFQLPIILTIMLRLKVIQRSMLTKNRKFVYAAIIIFAAILPPTDLLSLTLIIVPLVFLFEGALLLNR
jgi:sec-independent protein translocase protein TatC